MRKYGNKRNPYTLKAAGLRDPTRRFRRRRSRLPLVGVLAAVLGGGLLAAQNDTARLVETMAPPAVQALWMPQNPARATSPSRPQADGEDRRAMPICGAGRRVNCVVDGDTFWIAGEKIRVLGLDAPEVKGRCASEREMAQRATRRLEQLLSNSSIKLERNGKDRYGRTLARVTTDGGEVSQMLIREGLARPYQGRKEDWC